MKKIIITGLIAAMIISLCACDIPFIIYEGNSEDTSSAITTVTDTNDTAVSSAADTVNDTSSLEKASDKDTSSEKKKSSSSETPSSAPPISSEFEVIPIEIESQPTGHESEIAGEWRAFRILDPSGHEIDGEELYGTAYKTYGGSLIFNDDSTFSLCMGVGSDDPTSTGTFTYEGGDEIALRFYDDSSAVCTKQSTNGKDTITMPFLIFGDTFTVYFEK